MLSASACGHQAMLPARAQQTAAPAPALRITRRLEVSASLPQMGLASMPASPDTTTSTPSPPRLSPLCCWPSKAIYGSASALESSRARARLKLRKAASCLSWMTPSRTVSQALAPPLVAPLSSRIMAAHRALSIQPSAAMAISIASTCCPGCSPSSIKATPASRVIAPATLPLQPIRRPRRFLAMVLPSTSLVAMEATPRPSDSRINRISTRLPARVPSSP